MEILKLNGYELEKTFPTTSEDFFNRSEVHLLVDGHETVFSVLYVRTFLEQLWEVVPYDGNPIFTFEEHEFHLQDIIALIILIKNPDYANHKRLYINDFDKLVEYLKGFNYDKLNDVFIGLIGRGKYYIKAPQDFLE